MDNLARAVGRWQADRRQSTARAANSAWRNRVNKAIFRSRQVRAQRRNRNTRNSRAHFARNAENKAKEVEVRASPGRWRSVDASGVV
jgi:hypothetical protein